MKPEKPPTPAGRPRCFCPDKALDRALEVFWKKGFDGTSLTDLTEAMGINRPSLYAAYGNKESLFQKAMARYGERGAGLMRDALTQPTARAFVEHLLLGSADRMTDPAHPPGCFLVQTSGASGDSPALGRAIACNRSAPAVAMRARFTQAQADGELPAAADVAALARFFAAVLAGLSTQAAAGATTADLRAVVAVAIQAWPAGR